VLPSTSCGACAKRAAHATHHTSIAVVTVVVFMGLSSISKIAAAACGRLLLSRRAPIFLAESTPSGKSSHAAREQRERDDQDDEGGEYPGVSRAGFPLQRAPYGNATDYEQEALLRQH